MQDENGKEVHPWTWVWFVSLVREYGWFVAAVTALAVAVLPVWAQLTDGEKLRLIIGGAVGVLLIGLGIWESRRLLRKRLAQCDVDIEAGIAGGVQDELARLCNEDEDTEGVKVYSWKMRTTRMVDCVLRNSAPYAIQLNGVTIDLSNDRTQLCAGLVLSYASITLPPGQTVALHANCPLDVNVSDVTKVLVAAGISRHCQYWKLWRDAANHL